MQQLNQLFQCVYNIQFHLVFVTKYRRKCITAPLLLSLKSIFARLVQEWECELIEFNGESDHVHLLLGLNPKVQPSKLVNNLKTVSSRLIRKDFREHLAGVYSNNTFWSRSYCLVSCGGAPLSVLKQYIENQQDAE